MRKINAQKITTPKTLTNLFLATLTLITTLQISEHAYATDMEMQYLGRFKTFYQLIPLKEKNYPYFKTPEGKLFHTKCISRSNGKKMALNPKSGLKKPTYMPNKGETVLVKNVHMRGLMCQFDNIQRLSGTIQKNSTNLKTPEKKQTITTQQLTTHKVINNSGYTPVATFPTDAQFVIVKLPKTYQKTSWPKLHKKLRKPNQPAYIFTAAQVVNGYEKPFNCKKFLSSKDKFTKGLALNKSELAGSSGNFHEHDIQQPRMLKGVLPTQQQGICTYSTHEKWNPVGGGTNKKAMPTLSPLTINDVRQKIINRLHTQKPIGTNPYLKTAPQCEVNMAKAYWRIQPAEISAYRASNHLSGGYCSNLKYIAFVEFDTCRTDFKRKASVSECSCNGKTLEKDAINFYFEKWTGWNFESCK